MVRGNPRRDALEYGMLMVCTTGLTAGLGLMLYMRNSSQGLEKVDLNAPFDMKGAFQELKRLREEAIGGGAMANNNSRGSKYEGPSPNNERK
jgi:hypothetical protein